MPPRDTVVGGMKARGGKQRTECVLGFVWLVSAALGAVACSGAAKTPRHDVAQAGAQATLDGGVGSAGTTSIQTAGTEAGTSSPVGAADSGIPTSFGEDVPRDQFCARAPNSGVKVPEPRAAISHDPGITAPDQDRVCTGDLAKRTFRFGLCTCQDLEANGTLTTDAFNSTTGSLSKDGSIGVRTRMAATTLFTINGSLWVGGLDGAAQPVLSVSGSNGITGELHVGGDMGGSSFLDVGADAFVNGSIPSGSFATVHGKLHIPSAAAAGSTNAVGGVVAEPVSVPDPCNCDAPIAVATIVAAFENENDNGASGVDKSALIAPTGANLTLECGRYYFEGANIGGTTTLHLKGRTAIFIKGDFEATSLLTLTLDPGAELDLFVTGNVTINGTTDFGYKNAPARIRMYVGGTEVTLVSLATLGANIYARSATVTANGTLSMWGSLYADRIALTTLADFHYDSAVMDTEGCEPPTQQCDSCSSCSGGSCVGGVCSACVTSADCCAPLVCDNGACVLIDGPE